MNHSYELVLPNIITHNDSFVLSIDILYVGTFIGLSGGVLTCCVISYFKYKKKHMSKLDPIIQYI